MQEPGAFAKRVRDRGVEIVDPGGLDRQNARERMQLGDRLCAGADQTDDVAVRRGQRAAGDGRSRAGAQRREEVTVGDRDPVPGPRVISADGRQDRGQLARTRVAGVIAHDLDRHAAAGHDRHPFDQAQLGVRVVEARSRRADGLNRVELANASVSRAIIASINAWRPTRWTMARTWSLGRSVVCIVSVDLYMCVAGASLYGGPLMIL